MMVYNPDEIEKDFIEYTGGCWKCKKQITLKDKQVKCDNCGTLVRWWCNNCKQPFDVVDKESNKKLNECKICGYFVCPHCSVCSYSCDKYNWQKEILKILSKEIPIGKYPRLPLSVNEIVEYIESIKTSIERKCCVRNVPISYAKEKVKNLWAKVEGFKIKNENDRKNFIKRIDDATELEIGKSITINNIREDGSYGQEYRDALNLLVCFGRFKIEWKKDDNNKDYCVFTREDTGKCNFLSNKDVVIKVCPKCNKKYKRLVIHCEKCIWSKGKCKGESIKLKERLNNCDTCQMYRGNFKKGNGKS